MTFKNDLARWCSNGQVQIPQPICQEWGGGVARKFALCLIALTLFLGASAQEAITNTSFPAITSIRKVSRTTRKRTTSL